MSILLAPRPVSRLAAILSLAAASAASAAPDIGHATRIAPQVSGGTGGQTLAMKTGDSVVQNELIETAAAGNAQLRFVDATDLSIGPSSSVKLDSFVFATQSTAKSFVLDASKGTFRFATGNSNHGAYQILTPAAVIGVRGTRFSFTINGGRLSLTVTEGRVIVCPRNLGTASCVIVSPGQSINAQAGRPVVVSGASPGGAAPNPPPPPPPPGRRAQRAPIYGPPNYGTPDYVPGSGPPDYGPPTSYPGPTGGYPYPHLPIYGPHGLPGPWPRGGLPGPWPHGGYQPYVPGGYGPPRGPGRPRWPRQGRRFYPYGSR